MEALTMREWCPRAMTWPYVALGVSILAAAGFCLLSGDAELPQAPPADQTGIEFDPAKVFANNIGERGRLVAPVTWRSEPLDLQTFLARPEASVTWQADGKPAGARFSLGQKPDDDRVRPVRMVASEGGRKGSFTLTIIPPSTGQRFEDFIARESKDTAWTRALPPVYSRLGPSNSNPEPSNCKPRLWPHLREVKTLYHPGAKFEMRSAIQPDGTGHQATYDSSGALLRQGVAAGSADRGSPSAYSLSRLARHKDLDVVPYLWAAQLDGNPVNPRLFYRDIDAPLLREGEHIQRYLAVRPAFAPGSKELEPGKCASESK